MSSEKSKAVLRWLIVLIGFLVGILTKIEFNILFAVVLLLVVFVSVLEDKMGVEDNDGK